MKKISIIIPVFNERDTVGEIIRRVSEAATLGYEKEIIAVDDGSSDGTEKILDGLKEKFKFILLRHAKNHGKGAAIRTGLDRASGDLVLIQDADLEYDPGDYPALLGAADSQGTVVYGSRNLGSSGRGYFLFYWGGRFFTWFLNFLFGSRLTDINTGYKLFPREFFHKIKIDSDGFEFCEEITVKVLREGYRIREIPIHYDPRKFSAGKKIKFLDGLIALWTITKYRLSFSDISWRFWKKFSGWERGIFIASVLARLAFLPIVIYFLKTPHTGPWYFEYADDSFWYLEVAKNIFAGKGFYGNVFLEEGIKAYAAWRTPGYPFFIGLFMSLGLTVWAAIVIQIILFSFIPVLAMRLANRLGFSDWAGRLAGIVIAFEPSQFLYSVVPMADMPSALAFFAGCYFLIQFWHEDKLPRLFFSLAFFALANYLRPQTFYLSFLFAGLIFFAWGIFKKRWLDGLKFSLVAVGVLYMLAFPWMLRNYNLFGVYGFSSGAAPYLYYVTGSGIISAAEDISFSEAHARLREINKSLPEPDDIYSMRNGEIQMEKAKEIIYAHPLTFLKLYAFGVQTFFLSANYHWYLSAAEFIDLPSTGQVSLTRLFAAEDMGAVWNRILVFIREPYGMIALLGRMVMALFFFGSLLGAWTAWKEGLTGRFAAVLFLICMVYGALTVVTAVEGTDPRHKMYLNALIYIFAFGGLENIMKYFAARQKPAIV